MIIEQEAQDYIIYSDATREDFDNAVRDCQHLKSFGTYLERIENNRFMLLHWCHHDSNGTHKELMVKLDKFEQELTIFN